MTQIIQKQKNSLFDSLNSPSGKQKKTLPNDMTTQKNIHFNQKLDLLHSKTNPKNILQKTTNTQSTTYENFHDTNDTIHTLSTGNESNKNNSTKKLIGQKRRRKLKRIYSSVKSNSQKKSLINIMNSSLENCCDKNSKKERKINKKNANKQKPKTMKELIALNENKIIEQVNKEYSDIEYQKDLKNYLLEPKTYFMKENFPIMFRKDKFYLFTVLLKRRRKESIHFLHSSDMENINQHDYQLESQNQNVYNNYVFDEDKNNFIKKKIISNKENLNSIPIKVWSFTGINGYIDIEKFFDDVIQIWPFYECNFIKEISLEYLMKNNYDTKICLGKINEFVDFMKKRAVELDFPTQSETIKTVKKYHLRKKNL